MEEIKLFTKEEKEKLKKRIKDFEKLNSYQLMKLKFYSEIKEIDEFIKLTECEQIQEFKSIAENRNNELREYKKDLIECLGFIFDWKE